MLYLSENLKKYRLMKNLTQEDIADYLGITAQSVSKWERDECYPDITFLPALANIFETSVDLLIGMDTIRAEETRYNIQIYIRPRRSFNAAVITRRLKRFTVTRC